MHQNAACRMEPRVRGLRERVTDPRALAHDLAVYCWRLQVATYIPFAAPIKIVCGDAEMDRREEALA